MKKLFRISLFLFSFWFFGQTKSIDLPSSTSNSTSSFSVEISKEILNFPECHFLGVENLFPDWDISKENDTEEVLSEVCFSSEVTTEIGYDILFSSGIFTQLFLSHQTPLYDLFCCWKYHLS